jgi:hypothetical protein
MAMSAVQTCAFKASALIPHERLDLQVLLQRFEQQLDLPALLVEGRDGRGPEGQVIGQERDGTLPVGVVDLNQAQPERAVVRRRLCRGGRRLVSARGSILRDGSSC